MTELLSTASMVMGGLGNDDDGDMLSLDGSDRLIEMTKKTTTDNVILP